MPPFVPNVHKDRFTILEIGHQRFSIHIQGPLEGLRIGGGSRGRGGQAEIKGFSMEQVFYQRKDAHA